MARTFNTAIQALLTYGVEEPERPFLTFVDGDTVVEAWSFKVALDRARQAAGALRGLGLAPHDRLIIVGGNEPAVVALLLGAMGSGLLPAIVHPPLRAEIKAACAQLEAILTCAEPAWVIAPPELCASGRASCRYVERAALFSSGASPVDLVAPGLDEPAYLQFSSGSTGGQKAIILSAHAQAASAAATAVEIGATDADVWVSWLPLYHDMGLMAGVLIPMCLGQRSFILPPERFVERPTVWLQALSAHHGTLTVAPNFAYALAARRATPERIAKLDLSRLRVAFNGAEAVSADSIEQFERALAPAGLKPNTVLPVYGLAEFTLSAAYWRMNEPIRVDRVARVELAKGRAEPAGPGERRVVRIVSVGRAVHKHDLRIVGEQGQICVEREVGEIELMGPSRMLGYLGDPASTALALDGEWLKTGDLGYVSEGDLFVCGRKKDLVIRFGENFYPTDLEQVAATTQGLKAGKIAVVGVADPRWATERVWLLAEADVSPGAAKALAQDVRAHVVAVSGFKLDGVSIVPAGFIEKTSSGKIRRLAVRDTLAGLFRAGAPPPSVGRWPS